MQAEQSTETAVLSQGDLATFWGYHLRSLADYEGAGFYLRQALAIRERMLGENHADTADSCSVLGILLYDEGRFEEALPYYQRALAIREQVLGPEHPHTARSVNNMGVLLWKIERI